MMSPPEFLPYDDLISFIQKQKSQRKSVRGTLSWLPNDFEYRKFMHEVASLFPLARLAVGFGRKRAALSPVTRSWRMPLNSPRDPKKKSNSASQVHPLLLGQRNDAHQLLTLMFKPYWFPRSPLTETQRDRFMKSIVVSSESVPLFIPRTSVQFSSQQFTEKMISCFDACCKALFKYVFLNIWLKYCNILHLFGSKSKFAPSTSLFHRICFVF